MPKQPLCPFCTLDPSRIVMANDHAIAIYDTHPVTPGHALIIPNRHMVSFFEATKEERVALLDLLSDMRELLLHAPHYPFDNGANLPVPDGFNIGINDGTVAGQTIMHLHVHLIPRHAGDSSDPRGGVRRIMPDKAPYWKNQ